MRTLLALALLTSLLATRSVAEPSSLEADSLLTLELDPIVVTGTRVEVARSNVPLTVTTVSGETIRRSGEANVLPVLSRHVPGLFVTERGVMGYGISGGSAGRITIRGVGGSPGVGTPNTNILVMVDGHPQFMGIFGHPFPDAYVTSDAERVEVIRGPASILYGTGAMGGVINVITTRLREDGVRASASAAYGSYATQHYSGSAGIRRNGSEGFVSINHDRTNGHRDALDHFNLTNLYLKGSTPVSAHWSVTADGRLTKFHTEDPGPASAPNDSVAQDADVLRARVAVALDNRHGRSEGSVRAYLNYGDHEIFDGFESEDFNGGLVAYQAFRVTPGLVTTVGVDAKRYGGKSRNVLGGVSFGDHSVTEVGGYGFIQYVPVSRLVLSGGARIESNSEFGSELAPQIGAALQVATGVTLRTSIAKGYRSPTILELYLFPPANPDLEPERMWNYEASARYAQGRLQAELVGFVSKGSNLIEVRGAPQGGPLGPLRRNVGEFTNKGIEFQLGLEILPSLLTSGNVSYLHSDAHIVGAPEWMGFVDVTYARSPVSVGLEVQLVRDLVTNIQPDPPGPAAVTADFTLVNVRASYRPVEYAEVFVRLENLLDESYEINFGYPMPGTTFMTGVRLRY